MILEKLGQLLNFLISLRPTCPRDGVHKILTTGGKINFTTQLNKLSRSFTEHQTVGRETISDYIVRPPKLSLGYPYTVHQ